ncbi:hypothetical protein HJC23_013920 [Cyclotella cryptica]|uniref:Orc1-like AAA ATPase domain-containing protein n=1 Tax=Cyclotella cryptica TaxID=29204 RepID=A0ABD3QGL0_9STRA
MRLHDSMIPPNPSSDISRQAQKSLNRMKDKVKGTYAINSCNLPSPNALDSLFGHSNSLLCMELDGNCKQGTFDNFANCSDLSLVEDDTEKHSGSNATVIFRQPKESTWLAHTKQTVFAFDKKTSEPGPKFYPVEAIFEKEELAVPLRQWITLDAQERATQLDQPYLLKLKKASTLRKVTISFAITTLLQHLSLNFQVNQYSPGELKRFCSIDNFVIRVSAEQSDLGWEVMGVNMINPQLQLKILTGVSLTCNFFDRAPDDEFTGRSIMSRIISPHVKPDNAGYSPTLNDESMLCYFLGLLLHGLFSGEDVAGIKPHALQNVDRSHEDETSAKKKSMEMFCHMRGPHFSRPLSVSGSVSKNCRDEASIDGILLPPLSTIGYSTSLSQVVTSLVDCGSGLSRSGDSYPCLEMAISDMCLLLEDPGHFLFEEFQLSPKEEGIIYSGREITKLYGRAAEAHLLTDTFCRVASTRESEACLITGFSGCGKTRLVESVFEAVEAVDGFVVAQKFDKVSTMSPLSVVMSAFNELCLLVSMRSTPQELHSIYENLIIEFGANFHDLARALPNVLVMLSTCNSVPFSRIETDDFNLANYSSLCCTLQRFMRVVSSTSRTFMIFLDDLQWADPVSLGLVHAVLSDIKGKSSMLFIGTFRDNEVGPDHIIFGFLDMLTQFNVTTCKIHLNGLAESDVNAIISDALGTLPRLCTSLSQVVSRKTHGNPYYVLEFLRSIVGRDIVRFSLRERRWIWDDAKVYEENITENVLHQLSDKLKGVPENILTALKCASCFGIRIEKSIAQILSTNSKYIDLHAALDGAVEDGFMDCDGTHYRFVHDKLSEAAYDLIKADYKDEYHFELGMAMHSSCVYEDSDDALFATIQQINHGVPSLLTGSSLKHDVAELNYEASVKSMHCSKFTEAYGYIKAALSLLADDSWTTQYSESIKYHLQLGKSAISCGSSSEANVVLGKVLDGGRCLEDKIDAYFLLCHTPSHESVQMCVHVLRLLGEELPHEDLETCLINSAVSETKEIFEHKSDEAFLCVTNSDHSTERTKNIIKFYGHLSVISWIAAPKMHAFYMARFARFCLKSKVTCKYLPLAFVGLGACLCYGLTADTLVGYRMGKTGLMILNRSELDMDETAKVYLAYYRELGVLFEPIQACADMHRRGHELGMKVGNTSLAGLHLCLAVDREIMSGKNLQLLKAEIEFYLNTAKQHSLTAMEVLMQIYYKTVLTLIGEQCIGYVSHYQCAQYEDIECTQEMMSSLFSGHFDRVTYLAKKWEALNNKNKLKGPLGVISVAFYSGLATTSMYRTKGFKFPQPLRHISQRLLPVLTTAEECSQWNFKTKASILRAEYLSLTAKKDKAEHAYGVGISSAQSSRFIHEEGMACELAGMHYKHHGDKSKALDLFRQAQKCYEAWGSRLKVDQMVSTIQEMQ